MVGEELVSSPYLHGGVLPQGAGIAVCSGEARSFDPAGCGIIAEVAAERRLDSSKSRALLTVFNLFGARPDGTVIVATLVAFIIGTTIHEFSHAWSALMLGDDTAQRQGRITLNPLMHFDPIGFLGMVLIAIGGFGIGWGRPVPINPGRLWGHQRGMAITALAGPLSNVVLATLCVIPLRFGQADLPPTAHTFLTSMIWVNLLLASFNLIPIPPLDGHKILTGILPNFWYPILAPLERYGVLILIGLVFLGGIGQPILGAMFSPVFDQLQHWIAGPVLLAAPR